MNSLGNDPFHLDAFASADRIDIPQLSVLRLTGAQHPPLQSGEAEFLVVPNRPVNLRHTAGGGQSRTLRLCPNVVCAFGPDTTLTLSGPDDLELMVISVEPRWCARICAAQGLAVRRVSEVSTFALHPDLPPIVHAIRRQVMQRDCPDEPYLTTYVALLLNCLIWHNGKAVDDPAQVVTLDHTGLHDVLRSVDARIDETIRVTELAGIAGMTNSQFSRAFKSMVGVSPRYYILYRRLERARELLENTEQALSEIALEAGFSSQAHLTSMFAREFGMPPGLYRKSILKDAGSAQSADS